MAEESISDDLDVPPPSSFQRSIAGQAEEWVNIDMIKEVGLASFITKNLSMFTMERTTEGPRDEQIRVVLNNPNYLEAQKVFLNKKRF